MTDTRPGSTGSGDDFSLDSSIGSEQNLEAIGLADGTSFEAEPPESDPEDGHVHHGKLGPLALAALGVVFGDIGTSPLYSLQTVFSTEHNAVAATREDVFGVISMALWAITLIVSFKYVFLVMRADNEGEGGILALVALLRLRLADRKRLMEAAIVMGMVGAALFYGDSVITPAISVMSAFEGLSVASADLESWVLPLSLVVLTALFAVQRFGTATVGRRFGPVMALWFVTLAVLGIPQIVANPEILAAVLPHHALEFAIRNPFIAFIAMGAVVLTITGAEALYADMGHFGPRPIRLAWFGLVFPALAINYLGQGAMILRDPGTIDNPFFHLAPEWATLPLVALATIATVIASQAVISGAFSVSRQANRLGLLPRQNVKHTSREEGGQIYIGAINWFLYVGVLLLIGIFQSSAALASAYGLAVTGTLLLTTLLFLVLAHSVWRVALWKTVVAVVLVLCVEAVFFAANVAKITHGGWLPLVIAALLVTIMATWRQGAAVATAHQAALEGPLDEFIEQVHAHHVPRVPGVAVFPHPDRDSTPLALRQNVGFNHVLHEYVVIVSIINENVPHIRHVDRASVHDLGYAEDGIVHVRYRVGFNDSQDVPKALWWAQSKVPEIDLDPERARYFLSVLRFKHAGAPSILTWRKQLFLWMSANAADRTAVFHLPPARTVVMGGQVDL